MNQLLTFMREKRAFLIRFAIRQGCPPDLAEDVVQDACIGALEGFHRFNHESSLSTWFLAIVRYKCLSLLRKKDLLVFGAAYETASEIAREDPVQQQHVEWLDVLETLSATTEQKREALLKTHVEGYFARELASELSVSKNTIKTRAFYAKKIFVTDDDPAPDARRRVSRKKRVRCAPSVTYNGTRFALTQSISIVQPDLRITHVQIFRPL